MTATQVATWLGCVGLAASTVNAEVNWTTQMQFRNRAGGLDQTPLVGNRMEITATGIYTFTVQVGIFNLTGLASGQANYGLNNWTAAAQATGLQAGEAIGVVATNARVSPYSFGPATSFAGIQAGPGDINNIDAARDVSGGSDSAVVVGYQRRSSTTTDPASQPIPGSNTYASVWRFTVAVVTLSGPDVVVAFAGQAGPVVQWVPFGSLPPDESTPGWASFLGLTPTPVLRDYAPTTLTLHRVPTPSAAIALFAAAAVVCPRQRISPEQKFL